MIAVKPADLTSDHIERAFRKYDKCGMPEGYGRPIAYWVINPDNEEGYPVKALFHYAIPESGLRYNKVVAKFKELGFEVISKPGQYFHTREEKFKNQVESSLRLSQKIRLARLKKAPQKPAEKVLKIRAFNRNPNVVAEVLFRAQGKCECCGNDAPFKRKKGGKPYLEVHHKIQLAKGGDDTVANAFALCPNCHREQHFGKNKPALSPVN